MRKGQSIVLFGLIPAVVIAGAVLLIGTATNPPRYTARAVIAVDWNSMPSVPNDEQADKVRSTWRKDMIREVINLPSSDKAMAAILKNVTGSSNEPSRNSANIPALKGRVKVKLVKRTAENDQFSIEVQSNDPVFVQEAAEGVLQEIISRINDEAEAVSLVAAGRSYANVEDAIQRRERLQTERRALLGPDSLLSRPEARQRFQEIEAELSNMEWDHMEAGIGLLGNLVDVFGTEAVKVVEKTRVENRRAAYGRGILFTAAVLGCMAGIVGLAVRRFLRTKSATNRTTPRVPPVINAPLQPPIINHANP